MLFLIKSFRLLALLILTTVLALSPIKTNALNNNPTGEKLFLEHCSGCHINGGNIVRRNRTLKLPALNRQGLDSPEAIAKVAREGIGSMSGYEEVLGQGGDELVAKWIWNKAQNAWTQG